ncbi:MAG: bifunctional DNA primase/polymerase [Chloroflexi bacterium]|nr:bifunctional DNA primase/polymerase [Chloroflexota bacterium]MBI3339639.1 bifunctional DNA primase/polymerase [Chloroflexota bacterium]
MDKTKSVIVQEFERYAEYIQSDEYKERERIRNCEARPLLEMQSEAIDLYRRGFNVFPLPSHVEWTASGKTDKHPYGRTGKLFYTRLHYCGFETCPHMRFDFVSFWNLTRCGVPNIGVMTGTTSGNLLIIDCDSKTAFQKMLGELTRRNIPYWAYMSYRGGACLVRVIEGEVANLPKKSSKTINVELWGNRHYAVFPPSLHPVTGRAYTWYTPRPSSSLLDPHASIPPVSIAALDWLGAKLHGGKQSELSALDLPEWTSQLSRRNCETLANGTDEGERNSRLTALAYDMRGCNVPVSTAKRAIQDAAARCRPAYPERDALAIVKSAYKQNRTRARDFVTMTYSHESNAAFVTRHDWEAAQTFANSLDWRAEFGRKSIKARAVFQACIDRAKMSASTAWRASERELAELANLHRNNIRPYKQAFLSRGWLVRPEINKFVTGGASLFLFGETVRLVSSSYTCTTTGNDSDGRKMTKTPKTDLEQNIFGAMRGCAWLVYSHLSDRPETTKAAIARAVNQPVTSVKAALDQLISARLVSASEGAFISIPATDETLSVIKTIAVNGKEKPVKERAKTRREKHKAEREINASVDMLRAITRYREKHPIR